MTEWQFQPDGERSQPLNVVDKIFSVRAEPPNGFPRVELVLVIRSGDEQIGDALGGLLQRGKTWARVRLDKTSERSEPGSYEAYFTVLEGEISSL